MEKILNQYDMRKSLLFTGLFAGIYTVLYTLYFMVPDSVLRETVYHIGIVSVCTDIINVTVPTENVIANVNIIQSSRATLEIVRGCDGIGSIMLILSAITAFSTTFKHKAIGLVAGIAVMYSLNLLRVVVLYFISAYQVNWFISVHTFVAPTLVILTGCIFFAWWAIWSSGDHATPTTA